LIYASNIKGEAFAMSLSRNPAKAEQQYAELVRSARKAPRCQCPLCSADLPDALVGDVIVCDCGTQIAFELPMVAYTFGGEV
jgi:hypothetical protein